MKNVRRTTSRAPALASDGLFLRLWWLKPVLLGILVGGVLTCLFQAPVFAVIPAVDVLSDSNELRTDNPPATVLVQEGAAGGARARAASDPPPPSQQPPKPLLRQPPLPPPPPPPAPATDQATPSSHADPVGVGRCRWPAAAALPEGASLVDGAIVVAPGATAAALRAAAAALQSHCAAGAAMRAFVTYANEEFERARRRLVREAAAVGDFDLVVELTPADIDTEFRARNAAILAADDVGLLVASASAAV
jgi:hypothetical protein